MFFSETTRSTNQHVFIWKITQFSLCCNAEREPLRSPIFTAECIDNTNWFIDFYPRGENYGDNFASCYLCRARRDKGDHVCICAFSMEIIGVDGKIFSSKQAEAVFLNDQQLGWTDFIDIEQLKHYKIIFPGDILFIRCRIKYGESWNTARNSWNFAETIIGSERIAFHVEVVNSNRDSTNELAVIHRQITFECPPAESFTMYVFFCDNDIKLYVIKLEEDDMVKAVCELSLIELNGSKGKSVKDDCLFRNDNRNAMLVLRLVENQLLKTNNRYKNDNFITLLFDITVSSGLELIGYEGFINQPLEESDVVSTIEIETELQEDLLKLSFITLFTDVILRSGNWEYHAHKAILSVRSPVLCDILEGEKVDVLYFNETEEKILSTFLEFLYVGTLTDITFEIAYKLKVLAEQYKVASLENWLNAWLGEMVSVGNLHVFLVDSALES